MMVDGLDIYYSDDFLQHKAPRGHPENEQRLITITNSLKKVNFFNAEIIEPRAATLEELHLVHTKEHIENVRKASESSANLDPDTYTSPGSFNAALKAAGSVIQAIDSVVRSQKGCSTAFCLTRPPGHHATANKAMGFCLFNNIAVGAAYFVKNRSKKAAILDFDAHHGNGTQDIFYKDDQVLYCSWHQWPHYPGTGQSTETGEGKGEGFTINIPLEAGSGDTQFIQSLNEVILPALEKFRPDMIMVSAGFDSHRQDPLSSLNFTEEGYAAFYKQIIDYCEQQSIGLLSCLEGGYNLAALSNSVLKCLEILSGSSYLKASGS